MTEIAHPDRLRKLEELRAAGLDPYPARGVPGEPVAEVVESAGTPEAPGPGLGREVVVAGRLLGLRDFGKLIFAPLQDRTGRMQVGLQKNRMGDWWPRRKLLDGGDLVAVRGELGHTQKGEPTVWAAEVQLLAKALAPPPEKWHGLTDVEARSRRRYVDLWASLDSREVFLRRSRVLTSLRRTLEAEGYLEVETPILHPIAGGATARPFVTHHNALGRDFFLRIAPELYLKRLIVGGLERVYEMARVFRNEGLSSQHNPEFTMLELYEAQADYLRMMEICERLVETAARDVAGSTRVTFRGADYELAGPYPRLPWAELFREHNGCDYDDAEAVRARARELDISHDISRDIDAVHLAGDVFEATVEDGLSGPAFVIDYPVELCPLAKARADDPRFAERFELFAAGMELANAFSELNDPAEQQRRFEQQVASKDPETPGEVDLDYVQALEVGMPPAGGLGIGVDRLVMLITGCDSIREVLLFPTLRPRAGGDDDLDGGPGAAEDSSPAAATERSERSD